MLNDANTAENGHFNEIQIEIFKYGKKIVKCSFTKSIFQLKLNADKLCHRHKARKIVRLSTSND